MKVPAVFELVYRAGCKSLLWINLTCWSVSAWAIDFHFSGFASFGVGQVTESKVDFGGYNEDLGTHTDNILGLQGQFFLTDTLSLTIQGISKGYEEDNKKRYEPRVEWLFLGYELTTDLRLRVGRLRTPHYIYSESLEVGYSYLWVRPPMDVYTQLLSPFRNFDGADLSHSSEFYVATFNQDVTVDSQIFAGIMQGHFVDNEIHAKPAIGLNLSATVDDFKFRYGYINMNIDIFNERLKQLRLGFNEAAAVAPSLGEVSSRLIARDSTFHYHSYGLSYLYHSLHLSAEQYFILGPEKGLSNDARGYFASVGYSVGAWTPYVVFGKYKNRFGNDIESYIRASESALPPGFNSQIDQLRLGARAVVDNFNEVERTYTVGVRWDVMPQVAVKAEFQHFKLFDNGSGQLDTIVLGDYPASANLFSAVIDVVF